MIASNSSPLSDSIPGKVERTADDPANTIVADRALKDPPAKEKSGGRSELAAANALAGLVTSPEHGPADSKELEEPADSFVLPEIYTRSGRKKAIPFPLKLMKVLSCEEYSDIITWLPNGRSFSIIRPKAFAAEILPVHFKEAKYSSFTRKLHRWGFQRHLRGDEAGAFFHKYFVRNRVDLVEKMTCHKPKSYKRYMDDGAPPARAAAAGMSPARFNMAQHHLAGPAAASMPQQAMANRARESQRQREEQETNELNEAIELEVSRRLRERIAAASLSRQALAVMQQQVQAPPMGMASTDPISTMQFMPTMNARFANAAGLSAGGLGMNPAMMNPNMAGLAAVNPAAAQALGGQNMNMSAAFRDAQEQCFGFGGGMPEQSSAQGLDMMPPTNIHNAKSA